MKVRWAMNDAISSVVIPKRALSVSELRKLPLEDAMRSLRPKPLSPSRFTAKIRG